jgi:hypothetical protein
MVTVMMVVVVVDRGLELVVIERFLLSSLTVIVLDDAAETGEW